MLKEERLTINGKELIWHYSDENKYLKQVDTGIIYSEAYDIFPTQHIYEETEEEIVENVDND